VILTNRIIQKITTLRNGHRRSIFLLLLLLSNSIAYGSTPESSDNILIVSLIIVGVILFVGVVMSLSDNLLQMEANKAGIDTSKKNFSLFPGLAGMFRKSNPPYVQSGHVTTLKKGHNIKLAGKATKVLSVDEKISTYAIRPIDFKGISPIPKVVVEVGNEVKLGDELFFDKKNPRVKYVAPVSGEVIAINRGAKRAINEVVILADKEMKYKEFKVPNLEKASRTELVDFLLESGSWPLIKQRPYNVLADIESIPANIFISTFNSAPLAPDLDFIVSGKEVPFQKGLDVLGQLTSGKVHLGLNASGEKPSAAFTDATGVQKNWFRGPHPAGNVGVQIHHTSPLGGADKIWTLGVQEVVDIGELFIDGRIDSKRKFAIVGSDLKNPRYVETYLGASIKDLLADENINEDYRIISGDVLSGSHEASDGFIGFYDEMITVVKEGNYFELFGWLLGLKPKPSVSSTFPIQLLKGVEFEADTNMHGEKRAFVVTGQYESMLPMDIYPQHLMKAIMTGDFEKMEGLGINELVEEDIALCEFACTSKMPLQSILRDGIDMMIEQGS
jgi:Na+-transporting NADH:ubiquinone oxidoreductase subunit A